MNNILKRLIILPIIIFFLAENHTFCVAWAGTDKLRPPSRAESASFNPAIDLAHLIPLKSIKAALKQTKQNGELEISGNVSDSALRIELNFKGRKPAKPLLRLTLGIKNALNIEQEKRNFNPGIPPLGILLSMLNFKEDTDYLANPRTLCTLTERVERYKDEKTDVVVLSFINLNKMAAITDLYLDPSIRRHGIGSRWFTDYIEPYLVRCGFRIIVIDGSCWDDANVTRFYYGRGFQTSKVLNIELSPEEDTYAEYQYLHYKILKPANR